MPNMKIVIDQPEPKPATTYRVMIDDSPPAPKPWTRTQRRVLLMLERQAKAGLAEAETMLAKIEAARNGQ